MVVIRELVESPTECGVYECTVRFNLDCIKENSDFMMLYNFSVARLCPTDLGHPHSRRRVIIAVTLKAKRVELLSLQHFISACQRTPVTTGQVYYCAPDDHLQDARAQMASNRSLCPTSPWSTLLTVGNAMCRCRHAERLIQKCGKPTSIAMIEQDVGFESSGQHMPCLTQISLPWSFDLGRPLLAEEAFVVQGMPAFELLEEAAGVQCPIDLKAISHCTLRSMSGNGQSLPAMGTVIMWLLSCTTHHEQPAAPRLMPPSEDSVDDVERASFGFACSSQVEIHWVEIELNFIQCM